MLAVLSLVVWLICLQVLEGACTAERRSPSGVDQLECQNVSCRDGILSSIK